MKLDESMKQALRSNISFLATCSKDRIPHVIPVGLVEVLDDSTIAVVDVLMKKTIKNLAENGIAALVVTDIGRMNRYLFKGNALVVTNGEIIEWARKLAEERRKRRREILEQRLKWEKDPEIIEKTKRLIEGEHIPKGVILIKVREIYRVM